MICLICAINLTVSHLEGRRGPISKYLWYIHLSCVLMLGLIHGTIFAQTSTPYLVQAQSEKCQHRLHPQPNRGPFSVFLFCDDALGSNIGVILTEPGGGPGAMKLTGDMVWDKWYTNDRFWQDKLWATDVVNFLWSPSLRYLYVATSGIYGHGGFFKLDLKERSFIRLLPDPSATYMHHLEGGYFTKIKEVDIEKDLIIVGIYVYDETFTLVAQEEIQLE